eukprot:jgi/Chrzof1/6713/Cz19g06170.t1
MSCSCFHSLQSIAAAAHDLDPSVVTATILPVLTELLKDQFADVRLAASNQAVAVGRRLLSAGGMYQTQLEQLLDCIETLLLDADTEVRAGVIDVLYCFATNLR